MLPVMATNYMKYGLNCSTQSGGIDSSASGDDDGPFESWFIGMFIAPFSVAASVTLLLVLYIRVTVYPRLAAANPTFAARIMACVDSVLLYPLIMVVFWLPNFIAFFAQGDVQTPADIARIVNIALITFCWSTLYPFGIAVYFFYRSEESRMRWRAWLGLRTHDTIADLPVDEDLVEEPPRFSENPTTTFNPTTTLSLGRMSEVEIEVGDVGARRDMVSRLSGQGQGQGQGHNKAAKANILRESEREPGEPI
jgi:hypothetical protein